MASRIILSCCAVLALTARRASAALPPQAICADANTSPADGVKNLYQSVGACKTTCGSNYAYAILQNNLCWCSNDIPATSSVRDASACALPCPGYPSDLCGGAGLFSYVLLDGSLAKAPKDSSKASDGSSSDDDGASSADPKTSSSQSPQDSPPPDPASATKPPTAHIVTPAAAPAVQTEIVGGIVQTVTVLPPGSNTSHPVVGTAGSTPSGSGPSTPAIVGIVIACIAVLALAMTGTAALILYKQRMRDAELIDDASARGGSDWEGRSAADKMQNPFADGSVASAGGVGVAVYGQRDRSGSIDTVLPPAEQCLRIVNPDPDPPEK